MARPTASAQVQAALGLPPGFKTFTPHPFGGMNTQASPGAIDDSEFVYLENLVQIGKGRLRTLWDVGVPPYAAPTGLTIIYFAFFTRGPKYYCAIFLSDGSAVELDMATAITKSLGPPGTFYLESSGLVPVARQWGSIYLLIANSNTSNDYWVWDGSLLYYAGTAGPEAVNLLSGGFDYSSPPDIIAYGGSGSGMAFSSTISGGLVTQVTVTSAGAGYLPGDQVQLQFLGGSDASAVLQAYLTSGSVGGVNVSAGGSGYASAPTVAFSGGGGSGAQATATIAGGIVTNIVVTAPGNGYTSAPSVTVLGGGGTGALTQAVLAPSGVGSISVLHGGSGFTSVPLLSLLGGGGSGATAIAMLTPTSIAQLNLSAGGSGYTSVPTVTFTGGGSVSVQATGTAIVVAGIVTGIAITNPGSGYASATVTINGGNPGPGGSIPAGTVTVLGNKIGYVTISQGDSGWTSAPTVVFSSPSPVSLDNGGGAKAVASIAGGAVVALTLTVPGTGITSPVQVSITGGGGSGAGATVMLAPTSIGSVQVTAAGQFYNTAPSVQVQSGANNAAYATVALMPFGVSGSSIETFLSRVWVADPATTPGQTIPSGNQYAFSAPGSVVDFSSSNGGGTSINTDAFLQTRYVNLRQANALLYFYGDGSVSVASNVQSLGSPLVTTYNYQNVDPQTGLAWRDSLQDFGRITVIANYVGLFALYGGAANKISEKLDGLLEEAVYPAQGGVAPSGAVAVIFGIKHYLNLVTLPDPDTGILRNVMLMWNEKTWSIASQSIEMQFIASQKIGSNYVAWGTDGNKLYPMFQTPSAGMAKRFETKYFGNDNLIIQKQLLGVWVQGQDNSSSQAGIGATIKFSVSGVGDVPGANSSSPSGIYETTLNPVAFKAPTPFFPLWGSSITGTYCLMSGIKFNSTAPDFTLSNFLVGYLDVSSYYGG